VLDARLKKRVIEEGLKPYFADTREAWTLGSDGRYRGPHRGKGGVCAQRLLLEQLAIGAHET
jgi:polyphosphate kinase